MARGFGLFRRQGIFYFRCRVPADLAPRIGRAELWRSLRTGQSAEARRRLIRVSAITESLFRLLRTLPMLTKHQIDALIRGYFEARLEADEAFRVEDRPKNYDWQADEWARSLLEFIGDTPEEIDAELRRRRQHALDAAYQWMLEHDEDTLPGILRNREIDLAEQAADALLQRHGLTLDPQSTEYRQLCMGILRADLEAVRIMIGRSKGDWSVQPGDRLFSGPPVHLAPVKAPEAVVPSTAPGPAMADLVGRYLREKVRGGVSEKWKDEVALALRWLREFHPDRTSVGSFTKADIVAFKDAMGEVPARHGIVFKGSTIRQAIELNKDRNLPARDAQSVNLKCLRPIEHFFAWAVANGHCTSNPAEGVELVVARSAKAKKKRDAFGIEDLKQMLASSVFAGAKSSHYWAEPGDTKIRDIRFWLPLMGLFSGGRLRELAQLGVDDVVQREAIWMLNITDSDEDDEGAAKSLKNVHSRRLVPIHPELVAIGFLDYVAARRAAKKAALFDEAAGARGDYGPFSKWFARFLDRLGLPSRRLVFHSFRHTFEQAMVENSVDPHVRSWLTGRAIEGSVKHYITGLGPPRMLEEISKVKYPGLDLSRLKGGS